MLTSYERGAGPASYTVRGTATIRSQDAIAFEDIFTGDQPANGAAAYVAGPLTLAEERVGTGRGRRISLTIDATEQQRSARIERVWLDTDAAARRPRRDRQGAAARSRGEEIVKPIPIQIPANATGSLQLLVADAARTGADDRREARGADSQRVSQLIRTFNKARRSNRLYVRLSSAESGAIVNGEPLAGIAAVGAGGARSRSQQRHLQPAAQRDARRMGAAGRRGRSGSRQLTISLDQP